MILCDTTFYVLLWFNTQYYSTSIFNPRSYTFINSDDEIMPLATYSDNVIYQSNIPVFCCIQDSLLYGFDGRCMFIVQPGRNNNNINEQ